MGKKKEGNGKRERVCNIDSILVEPREIEVERQLGIKTVVDFLIIIVPAYSQSVTAISRKHVGPTSL